MPRDPRPLLNMPGSPLDYPRAMAICFIRGTIAGQNEFDGRYQATIIVGSHRISVEGEGEVGLALARIPTGGNCQLHGSIEFREWDTERNGSRSQFYVRVKKVLPDGQACGRPR